MTLAHVPLLVGQNWSGNPLALEFGPFAYALAAVLTLLVFVVATADRRKKMPGTVKEIIVLAVMTILIYASDGGLWVLN